MIKNISIILMFLLTGSLIIYADGGEILKKKIGINAESGITYHRKGFGFINTFSIPINLVSTLYYEPGINLIIHRFSSSHAYAILSNNYDNKQEGIFIGVKNNLKYLVKILDNFGILTGGGFSFGFEISNTLNYFYNTEVLTLNFEIIPEFILGTYVNFKNFRIDIYLDKLFPFILFYYNMQDKTWYNYSNNLSEKIQSSIQPVCLTSMAFIVGFTYFFK
jgi:hypothetical protein